MRLKRLTNIKLGLAFLILNLFSFQLIASELIEISNVKMPKVPEVSRTAAIYLTIKNNSDKAIVLSDVKTPVAKHTMLHESLEVDGVAKMQHVEQLKIAAGQKVEFVPGGYHIMLMGMDKNLTAEPFNVTLKFANQVNKTFSVEFDKSGKVTKCPCCDKDK